MSQHDDPLAALPLRARYEIGNALRNGNTIEAIKLYREAAGCDLASAHTAIMAAYQQLRSENPYALRAAEQRQASALGCLKVFSLFVGLAVLGMFAFQADFAGLWQQWRDMFDSPAPRQAQPSKPMASQKQAERQRTVAKAPLPRPAESYDPAYDKPYQVVVPNDPERDLRKLYQRKFANPDYRKWLELPGLPHGYQDYPEEFAIKYARAQLAAQQDMPLGTKALPIPAVRPGIEVSIDGAIHAQEWDGARRVVLQPENKDTVLYLQADSEWLYLACDVPLETTEKGFDQFRFYFHINLDPVIVNERIHLGRHEERLGGIRQTTVIHDIADSKTGQNRRLELSDWQIFRMARGATRLQQHRQYEAKVHLAESGLPRGVAFPVFVEVETDPLLDAQGKFKRRVHVGELGSQQQPVWLLIL